MIGLDFQQVTKEGVVTIIAVSLPSHQGQYEMLRLRQETGDGDKMNPMVWSTFSSSRAEGTGPSDSAFVGPRFEKIVIALFTAANLQDPGLTVVTTVIVGTV